MDEAVQVLTFDDILFINWRMIDQTEGLFVAADDNLLNPGALKNILEQCQGSYYGIDHYPTAIEKAAVICWIIIARHVFHDGNKRTGTETCRQMLEQNGILLSFDEDAWVDMTLRAALPQADPNHCNQPTFIAWVANQLE